MDVCDIVTSIKVILKQRMKRYFWFILFTTVLAFDAWREQQYILIYFTMWTFILETVFFALLLLNRPTRHLFETIFAPSIVVFIGFWTVIAPMYISRQKPKNAVFVFVTHGCNALAMVGEVKSLTTSSIWKPIVYTIVYNLFLMCYVEAGGRSISGKLPYWYAQYEKPIGWVFMTLTVTAVALVHYISSTYIWPVPQKNAYIV